MFALSLEDFLCLLSSPSINIEFFIFLKKYHLKDTREIFQKIM